jgi:SAM-dependent methyltransferase
MTATGTSAYRYGTAFQQYAAEQAQRSAEAVVPLILEVLDSRSVLDVGCGNGMWLKWYQSHGVAEVIGIDGDYVAPETLLIPRERFRALDICVPFDLERRFDLVQCLEVAEHIRPEASRTLVASLTTHGHHVLFSAAVPGQGGENHLNERSYEFWRQLFAERGYVPFDFVRPLLQHRPEVAYWYRYNTILYIHESVVPNLPARLLQARVPVGVPIPDVSPLAFQLRKTILRLTPRAIVSRLAVLRHKLTPIRYASE